MPAEAPPAAATSAAVKEVRIVDSGPPKPPPAPTREMRASDIANLPGETRRPGGEQPTSRQMLRTKLESKAKPIGNGAITPTEVQDQSAASKPGDQKSADQTQTKPDATDAAGTGEEGGEQQTQTQATAEIDPATGKPKKANPWKLFEAEKKARATAEAEIQRLKTSIVPEQERTAIMERVTKAEARAKELEDHIRFVSYEKSQEFHDQYQAPYEAAWKRATTELSEIAITDPMTNQPRAVTSEDILELVNMPLGKAREAADQVFGKFADDVMAHRKEIKNLFEKQQQALEDARKNGGERDKKRQEQTQKHQAEVHTFVKKAWDEAVKEFESDKENGEFFKIKSEQEGKPLTPHEKELNAALERGYKLVDEAWSQNATAPNLTPEQRQAIIKKNVAVRNRAAAFGPMKRLIKHLRAELAAKENDLKQYSESTPGARGSTEASTVTTGSGGMEGFRQKLRKIAH